ncbi:hypothetical protein QBC42DRAFT_168803 [Cladorrhinum samala]|uniref:RING-type E3 ubiquitin transferase n=1 Tax=Cladorrhinum samala TaxID=585594 RepID=A0AAV9HXV5_9PEZI|nr:hypothetical protein QBC42DRAFT_168803 [Cladorrhinum samala]
MVLNIADGGLALDSSAKAMAGLPMQAFGITLSDDQLEELIAIAQNGGSIELSLGSDPGIWINGQEFELPIMTDEFDHDLYYTESASPKSINKLPEPVMPLLTPPNISRPVSKKTAPASSAKAADADVDDDDAIANLKSSLAKVASDKRENSAVVLGTLLPSKGKVKPGNRLLDNASPRSIPPSPLLSGVRSPSIAPGSTGSADKVKPQTFSIIHELAVLDGQSFDELKAKWNEGSEQEFTDALNKVAGFDSDSQGWVLKKRCWKELDVFEYPYSTEQDREQAINNAIKQYDRMRLGTTDPLWQKLLPKAERGKGVCLSKLQQAIASRGPTKPMADGTNSIAGDSEKDDSTSSGPKKGKGGEAMSRSGSQTSTTGKKKLSASEAQAKRLLSNKKSTTAASAKTSKASPAKSASKSTAAKGGRVLSKEIITDSDMSDDDDTPLAASLAKSKPLAATASRAPKEPLTSRPKPKPAAAAAAAKSVPKETEKEKDTIRPEAVAKPIKQQPVKRQRSSDDEDSSSSGTPLSKRVKTATKPVAKPSTTTSANSTSLRRASDASQNGRGVSSGATTSVPKAKNTSPMKSSPLASSPPTNASSIEQERRDRERERERERQRDRSQDTISSSGSSSGGRAVGIPAGKKRPRSDSVSDASSAKRQRVSQDTLNKAFKFKQFYTRYKQLHQEINELEDPDPEKLDNLCAMHDRLKKMKDEIYAEVPTEGF